MNKHYFWGYMKDGEKTPIKMLFFWVGFMVIVSVIFLEINAPIHSFIPLGTVTLIFAIWAAGLFQQNYKESEERYNSELKKLREKAHIQNLKELQAYKNYRPVTAAKPVESKPQFVEPF